MAEVIVIGAGLAGLAAAQRLQAQGTDVHVFDSAAEAGGHMQTVQRSGWRHERGPNSFLGSATALRQLADDVGAQTVAARPAANKRYLFLDGKLQALPASPFAAIGTPLLPVSAKLRLLAEPLTGARPHETDSVRQFFEQRIGREATDRFVDAFVSGIYAGDISQLGIAAAFPKIYAMAVAHGSLTRGIPAMLRAPRPKTPRGTFSFAGGLGDLAQAIGRKLGDRLHLSVHGQLRREGDGWRFGEHVAPVVVLAVPAWAAASLLGEHAAGLASKLEEVKYNPIVGVHLLYAHADIPRPLDGFGLLIPRRERVGMLGCLWNSAMFDVCPPDAAALTCFTGGAHDPAALDLSDDELLGRIRGDLSQVMGIKAAPRDFSIVRHRRGIPQYGRTHVALRSEIRRLASAIPGLVLTGNYFEGISMNDTVLHAQSAAAGAQRMLSTPGQELAA